MKASDAGIAAIRLLEALSEATDVFPPLKSAVGGALYIAKLVKEFRSNKKAWAQFADHIQKNMSLVVQVFANQQATHAVTPRKLESSLKELNNVLIVIGEEIGHLQSLKSSRRFTSFLKDPEKIQGMEKDLERALSLFHLNADIQLSQDVSKIVEDVQSHSKNLQEINDRLDRMEANMLSYQAGQVNMNSINLSELPYAQGATWNPTLMCHPSTRRSILKEVMDWIGNLDANGSAKIFCLTGVPGSGKTAIAHSIAKCCADKQWLATGFFFNRDDSLRASKVFSTIAQDLAGRNHSYGVLVKQAIKLDPSLCSAGLTRHFNELIAPFSGNFPQDKPIVIVLDGLDEGYSKELIQVLLDGIPKLPGIFKIFSTSRDILELQGLFQSAHTIHKNFVHNEVVGFNDVDIVAQAHLREVSEIWGKKLEGWPSDDTKQRLVDRSEGLMVWVVAICQYLKASIDPVNDLEELLEKDKAKIDHDAEEQMDNLYVKVLEKFRWKDQKFMKTYMIAMGTILSSKESLTSTAIEALHLGAIEIGPLLRFLKPLLLQTKEGQPIKILHQSLYDFLTKRALTVEKWNIFAVDEKLQSQRLAFCCIKLLNHGLSENTPGTGFLYGTEREIPTVKDGDISEALWYSCRFWTTHLQDVSQPSSDFIEAIKTLLEKNIVLWLELTVSKGTLQDFDHLFNWVDENCPQLASHLYTENMTRAFTALAHHLPYAARRGEVLRAAELGLIFLKTHKPRSESEQDDSYREQHAFLLRSLSDAQANMAQNVKALSTIREAVHIYRALSARNPFVYKAQLAWSLRTVSDRLSNFDLNEEALLSIKEAVEIYKELETQNKLADNDKLAWCLKSYSEKLSCLGKREEAFTFIKEAIEMYRALAEKKSKSYAYELACCLRAMSDWLSDLDQGEEALRIIRESEQIFRDLAEEKPQAFEHELAWCLRSVSERLASLDKTQEALASIKEAVAIYNKLAEQDPIAFQIESACCLRVLSDRLSDLNLKSLALAPVTEAVKIYREFMEQNPSVPKDELAWCLNSLSNRQSDLSMSNEALMSICEAVEIYRDLKKQNPVAFSDELAWCLTSMSDRLSGLGLKDEAFSTITEAVQMYRKLRETNQDAYQFELAWCLGDLSDILSHKGLEEDALQSIEEALQIFKQLDSQTPDTFDDNIAWCLKHLSNRLSAAGLKEEALSSAQKSVLMFRELNKRHSNTFNSSLTKALNTLSNRLLEMNCKKEAQDVVQEAAEINENLREGGVLNAAFSST
ncbi:hypothetical protein SCHPADRAFT_998931 [Schizopora paradoxa]|uniref:Nephrocystin 3-like N-terminal domain-containing protein n=1 Tax=Schizopora paradoxa TaxID=27342 RepID=A0A0H2RIB7_9AGAM|nr:hypothetical protein SCHPADRAFT_998931 [Schizopora paradoxa]